MRFTLIPAAYMLIRKENNILLKRRYNTGYEDGLWSVPAGHIDGNEPATVAAVRELEEEVGIVADPGDMYCVHVVHRGNVTESDERVHFVFECRSWEGEPKIMEPHKCDGMEWFAIDNLPKNIAPQTRDMIQKVEESVLYSEWGW